ncbi:MAG: Uma2 family endonuclease [Myxococcota bacterium]
MATARYEVDPADPRAPSQAVWDAMTEHQQRDVLSRLPSDMPGFLPPEGDGHRRPKTQALEALDEYFRRIRRKVYLSSELPVYYPDEPMFAPDLLAVLDVEVYERPNWVVSQEKRGLDLVLEVHVSGDAKKDAELNVERYGRLGIPEYFMFEPTRGRLRGHRLKAGQTGYEPIVPQNGRWESSVLELDLAIENGRLRFFAGSGALPDARELIDRLSGMVDDAVQRAETETRRAEKEASRAEREASRAERLAQKLRELGIDPEELD